MAVLQVRTMDDNLYEALGRRAVMDNRSISQEVVSMIKRFLAEPIGSSVNPDEEVLKLAGSWEDDCSAEEQIANIRSARKTERFAGGF